MTAEAVLTAESIGPALIGRTLAVRVEDDVSGRPVTVSGALSDVWAHSEPHSHVHLFVAGRHLIAPASALVTVHTARTGPSPGVAPPPA